MNKLTDRYGIKNYYENNECYSCLRNILENKEYFDLPFNGVEYCHTIESIDFYYTNENGETTVLTIL